MQILVAPTEAGYSLNDIKRAALTYDKVFVLDGGDRDLFPSPAFAHAMGMPPIMSMPGRRSIRPMGKTQTYDADFESLVNTCKPLIDAGVMEVTSTWNRAETKGDTIALGSVPTGGYQLNVQAVLRYYRALARDNEMLRDAIDPIAIDLASSPNVTDFVEQGQADGNLSGDPALPSLDGPLQNELLRLPLTVMARSRIAMAIKTWGVAEQRGLVPALPYPSARVLDRLAQSCRSAIDTTEDDPYWSRRTSILDMVVGEFVPDAKLSQVSPAELLRFRTKAMSRAATDRAKLFADVRAMAGEQTNLDLDGFRDRIRERLQLYRTTLDNLHSERSALGWTVVLDIAKGATTAGAAAFAAGGIFQIALPVSLSAALLGAAAWGIGKVQENLPAIRNVLAAERAAGGSNEFAVFRHFVSLEKLM